MSLNADVFAELLLKFKSDLAFKRRVMNRINELELKKELIELEKTMLFRSYHASFILRRDRLKRIISIAYELGELGVQI